MNHKKRHAAHVCCVAPRATDQDDEQVAALQRKALRVEDFENTLFKTLEEASQFPYPTIKRMWVCKERVRRVLLVYNSISGSWTA